MSTLKFNCIDPPDPPSCKPIPPPTTKFGDYLAPPTIVDFKVANPLVNFVIPPKVVLKNGKYFIAGRTNHNDEAIVREGHRYLITPSAVYERGKRETQLACNARPVITRFIHLYDVNGKVTEFIEGLAVMEDDRHVWRVKKKDFKNLFKILRSEFGDIFVAKNLGDGSEAALSDLYLEAKNDKTIPIEIQVEISGWYCIKHEIRWFTGIDEEYKNVRVPDVSALDKKFLFEQGLKFLDIGHFNSAIAIIFLFAHAAISRWWMNKAGIDWKTALIVQGITNSFKTSVVSLIANVFSDDRDNVRLPIALITESGGRRKIAKFRGQVALIDDFSKSSKHSAKESRELAEMLIRMNGDSGGYIKSAGGNSRKTITERVECVLIFTAETDFGLGNSTDTRYVTVRSHSQIIDRDGNLKKAATFDKDVIQYMQDNHQILKNYFSSYINFLTAYGPDLISTMKQGFRTFRSEYSKVFQTPRMAESAAILKVQADLFCEFARFSGINDTAYFADYYGNAIQKTIAAQQEKSLKTRPHVLYLLALNECLENSKIADTETEYVIGSDYVGFHQHCDGTLWLETDFAWNSVTNLLRKRGVEWFTTYEELKEMLFAAGYIYAKKTIKDGGEHTYYSIRAKKGARKSKLVFYYDKLKEISEGGNDYASYRQ